MKKILTVAIIALLALANFLILNIAQAVAPTIDTFTATPKSLSQINLNWTASGANIVRYELYSTSNGGEYIYIGPNTSFSHTGLTEATAYQYMVDVFNADGEDSWSGIIWGETPSGSEAIPPVISETTPVTTPTNDTTPNYTFTTDEDGTITYGGDCSSATAVAVYGSNTVTFNALGSGAHSNCTITVTDSSLNVSNILSVTAFTVDNTAPVNQDTVFAASTSKIGGAAVTIVSSGDATNNVWFAPSGTITFSAGATMTTTGGTATSILAPATAGDYKLFVIDAAGNYSAASTATLTVDNTAPVNQDAVFAASTSKAGGAAVTIVSSGDATNNVWFAPSGTTTFSAGATMTTAAGDAVSILAPATAGDYKLFVIDAAGNYSTASTATLTVDNAAPTADITYSDADGIVKSGDSLVITATFSEPMADAPIVKIAISGSNTVGATNMTKTDTTHYTYTHTVAAGNGSAAIALSIGTDIAGNVITATPTSGDTFTVDNSAPVNQDAVFAASTSKTGGASVTIVSSGDATNNVWFAPSGTTTFSAGATMTTAAGDAVSILAPVTDGDYKLFVIDAAGNYSTASTATLTVDGSAPVNQDTVFASSTSKQGGAAVTIVSSGDATNNVWFAPSGTTSFSASAIMTTAGGTATSILAPATAGSYKLFVIDSLGNYSAASTATLTVDNTAPTNQDTVFAASASKQGGAAVTIVSSGDATNNVWFAPSGTTSFSAGATMTTAGGTATSILAPATAGSYKLFVIDAVGNYSTSSTVTLTVDNTAPVNQDTVFAASASKQGGAAVTIISSGDATNNVWFAPSGTITFVAGATMTTAAGDAISILAPATAGSYKLFVLDAAGNISTESADTLTVDNTAPVNQDAVFVASASKAGGAAVTIVSSGDATNNVWFAPSGTTTFVAGATMTTAAGDATSILSPATAGTYKLFVLDAAGNISSASTETLTVTSSAKNITSFNFASPSTTGTVNNTAHTVALSVSYGTAVTALVPTIVVSSGATINPLSGVAQNFTNPVTYTVTAEDLTTQAYTVTVTVAAAPPSGGGGGGGGPAPTSTPSTVTGMSISINSGAPTTNNPAVTLTIGATKATKMAISNNSSFSGGVWETYAASKSWTLTSGDGTKNVYIKFQDASGVESAAISDSIVLGVAASAYPDGTILKSSAAPEVYVIKSGQKEWIKTAADFTAGGYKWENLIIVSPEALAAIPFYGAVGAPVPTPAVNPAPDIVDGNYPDGSLLKTQDSFRVYVVMSQKKKWISTPEVFETLGYKWTNIKVLSKDGLNKIADFEDNLIRTIGDYKVYLVVNGLRHHIPNPEIFLDYGFGWGDVKDVAPEIMAKYQMARLIRESKQGKIYYLSAAGVKKWIPTAVIFDSYGNKWEDIQVISKKEMESYSVGNIMRYGGKLYLISGTYKKLIPTDAIFKKNKYDPGLILDANKTEFDWYKAGSNVK